MDRVDVQAGLFAHPIGVRLLRNLREEVATTSDDARVLQTHLGTTHTYETFNAILQEIPVPQGRSALDDYVLMERVRSYLCDGKRLRRTRATTACARPRARETAPTVVSETTSVASQFSRTSLLRPPKADSSDRAAGTGEAARAVSSIPV